MNTFIIEIHLLRFTLDFHGNCLAHEAPLNFTAHIYQYVTNEVANILKTPHTESQRAPECKLTK